MFAYSNLAVWNVAFVVVLSLALSGVALCSAIHLVGAKWHNEVKHLATSLFALFPLAFVMLVVMLLNGPLFFHWWGQQAGSHAHIPGWYQPHWFIAREVIGMLFMMWLYSIFIKRQAVSGRSPEDAASFHNIATVIPFFFVLYSTMIAWDFEMTLVPAWHSAIYGLQQFISNFGMFLAMLVVWATAWNSRPGQTRPIAEYIYNHIAQMLLAFTLLWIYTYYSQYLTIWYGNLPDETGRVFGMERGDYAFLWWSVIALKFVIPFSVFAFPGPRHNVAAINAVAIGIIIGTVFERFLWIGGITGTGDYPVVAAIVIGGAVGLIGYTLVKARLKNADLVQG
ncbi:MAG: hypothetical protein PHH47_08495 [Gallionella sp.]|nr:hypothetical protein [Gallionella sp.]MDD4945914.1 hypothetical protein [Gallionella sp.]MDD5611430.1 hypothetical protein [Gallionella sp.]